VVVGTAPEPQVALARFQADGTALDTSFGSNGLLITKALGGAVGSAVAIRSQDDIVVA